MLIKNADVAESGDEFAQVIMNFQWFQPLNHSAFMQRRHFYSKGF